MINDHKFLCDFYNYDCVLTTNINKTSFLCYGSFTLMLSGLGYGLQFRFQTRWLHCTSQNMFTLHRPDSDPIPLFLYRTGIRVRVRLRQCKWAITCTCHYHACQHQWRYLFTLQSGADIISMLNFFITTSVKLILVTGCWTKMFSKSPSKRSLMSLRFEIFIAYMNT